MSLSFKCDCRSSSYWQRQSLEARGLNLRLLSMAFPTTNQKVIMFFSFLLEYPKQDRLGYIHHRQFQIPDNPSLSSCLLLASSHVGGIGSADTQRSACSHSRYSRLGVNPLFKLQHNKNDTESNAIEFFTASSLLRESKMENMSTKHRIGGC